MAHLAEWQHLLLDWYEEGLRGGTPQMPAPGCRWNETPSLNRAIWEKHRSRSEAAVQADFDSGYTRIVRLVETLSPEQMLESGHYAWTGKNSLTMYVGPNTASHYRFALQAFKHWLKATAGPSTHAPRPYTIGIVVTLINVAFKVKSTGRIVEEDDETHIWHFDDKGLIIRFCHECDTYQHWLATQSA